MQRARSQPGERDNLRKSNEQFDTRKLMKLLRWDEHSCPDETKHHDGKHCHERDRAAAEDDVVVEDGHRYDEVCEHGIGQKSWVDTEARRRHNPAG